MTAVEFRGLGVAWLYLGGRPHARLDGASAATRQQLADEIARRAAELAVAARRDGVSPHRVRLAGATRRWGQCEVCGDATDAHRGGTCMLCVAAIRRVRAAAGETGGAR